MGRGVVRAGIVSALIVSLFGATVALAVDSKSQNYQVSETQFGSTSDEESCSGEFCSRVSIGEFNAGEARSSEPTAEFETIDPDSDPLLEVIVEPGESNLGQLSTERTATKTTVVKIRTYLSDGYTLHMYGNAPRIEGHELATSDQPTASDRGEEQFGINVVENTSPEIGANPVQIPNAELSYGAVEPNYAAPDQFMYQNGAVIARSIEESGRTDYTISMIVNISNQTPAGNYASDFSAVVVPVF